jgi:transposase InsO family protein
MPKKRFSAEQIVTLLRRIGAGQICARGLPGRRDIAAELRDELLNGEIFNSLREAQIVIEQWRKHYNAVKLHSVLNYRRRQCPNIRTLGSPSRWDRLDAVVSHPLV